jgi:hypothetical protein
MRKTSSSSTTTENPIITNPEAALSYWSAEAAEKKRQSRSKIQNLEVSRGEKISVDQPSEGNPSRDLEAETNNIPSSRLSTVRVEKAKDAHEITIADNKITFGRYAIVVAGVIAIFIASYVTYRQESTQVLVVPSQISQCSDYEELYSFAPVYSDDYSLFHASGFTSANEGFNEAYLVLSSTYNITGNSQKFSFAQSSSGCKMSQPFVNYSMNGNRDNSLYMTFYGKYDGNISTGSTYCVSSGYENSADGMPRWNGTDYDFELICHVYNPGGQPQTVNEYLDISVNCSGKNPNIELIAHVAKSGNSIYASCSASICGTPLLYYSTGNTIQPTGIYQCTVPNSRLSSLSSAFANSLVANNGLLIITMCSIAIYALGLRGFIDYAWNGGKLS